MSVFNNPSKPAGLAAIASLISSVGGFAGMGNLYAIAPGDTSGYWPGDLVTSGTSAGNTFGAGGDTLGTPIITKYVAGSGHPVVGVVQAVGIDPTGSQFINPNVLGGAASNYPYAGPGGATYRPAAAQSVYFYAFVLDDPFVIYEIQEGGATTNLTQTAVGLNAEVVVANPATIGVTAQSGTQLDNNTNPPATTATFPLKILRLAPRVDNGFTTVPSTGGGGQKWWVCLNNHFLRAGTTAP
jgi:hypothetical protein